MRATQYLPGIVQLQQQMYDSFHRKLDRNEANQSKIGDFISLLGKGKHSTKLLPSLILRHVALSMPLIENKKNLFREKLKCLEVAWGLVKEQLSEYSK